MSKQSVKDPTGWDLFFTPSHHVLSKWNVLNMVWTVRESTAEMSRMGTNSILVVTVWFASFSLK